MSDKLRRYTAEAVGLFVVMLCGCGASMYVADLGIVGAALAFGLSLAVMMTVFGPVSGGHFNPAVSLGMFIKGRIGTVDFLGYLGGQLVGAFAAAGFLMLMDGGADTGLGANEMVYLSPQLTIIAETVFSFIFVLVFLEIVSQPKLQSVSGLLIGLAMAALSIGGYWMSGPSLNPFRSLATALLSGEEYLYDLWVYLVAPLIGGGLAGLAQPWLCKDK